jgi:hypothetical protein
MRIALIKTFLIVAGLGLYLFLSGCAASGGYRVDPYYYGNNAYYTGSYIDSTVRVAPCQPYRADALMNWAKELDEKQHSRSANVSVQNGAVNCTTSENASSQTSNRK